MRALVSCLLGAILSSCVSNSEIVPAGKDSYLVSGKAVGGMNSGESLIAATKAANAYCATQKKFMVIRNTDTGGNAGFGGERSQLIFSCVDENDPEYKRPNLRPAPTTVIEDQRSH
jgi:hypothetical protein